MASGTLSMRAWSKYCSWTRSSSACLRWVMSVSTPSSRSVRPSSARLTRTLSRTQRQVPSGQSTRYSSWLAGLEEFRRPAGDLFHHRGEIAVHPVTGGGVFGAPEAVGDRGHHPAQLGLLLLELQLGL